MSAERTFLFLQGPHGPFFSQLARALQAAGHRVLKAGFNGGDAKYWRDPASFREIHVSSEEWPETFSDMVIMAGITDIVLYGDTRPLHASAIRIAKASGVRIHCFEEGYLRPYWITYEREGSNGNSPLVDLSLGEIAGRIGLPDIDPPDAPANWGESWHHSWYGARYHFEVLRRRRGYPAYRTHRRESIPKEVALHVRRLVTTPVRALDRSRRTKALLAQALPYHVVLLQLAHDANMRVHSSFASADEFVSLVVDNFAAGAPKHHQLVFKAHPFEDGREPISDMAMAAARRRGVADRVWFIPGGRLGPLLDHARSAVTINSTAAHQALWRGLPVKVFGKSIYSKPELVSRQPLDVFFAKPIEPDVGNYRIFRQFLLETSQIPGGFYSASGRQRAIRALTDRMLDECDIYAKKNVENDTIAAKLRLVDANPLTGSAQ